MCVRVLVCSIRLMGNDMTHLTKPCSIFPQCNFFIVVSTHYSWGRQSNRSGQNTTPPPQPPSGVCVKPLVPCFLSRRIHTPGCVNVVTFLFFRVKYRLATQSSSSTATTTQSFAETQKWRERERNERESCCWLLAWGK